MSSQPIEKVRDGWKFDLEIVDLRKEKSPDFGLAISTESVHSYA